MLCHEFEGMVRLTSAPGVSVYDVRPEYLGGGRTRGCNCCVFEDARITLNRVDGDVILWPDNTRCISCGIHSFDSSQMLQKTMPLTRPRGFPDVLVGCFSHMKGVDDVTPPKDHEVDPSTSLDSVPAERLTPELILVVDAAASMQPGPDLAAKSQVSQFITRNFQSHPSKQVTFLHYIFSLPIREYPKR